MKPKAKQASAEAPCSVEIVGRRVIEKKLLDCLQDSDQVAILASRQDLEDFIFACKLWPMRDDRGTRLGNLQRGMEQLLREAFPPNSD